MCVYYKYFILVPNAINLYVIIMIDQSVSKITDFLYFQDMWQVFIRNLMCIYVTKYTFLTCFK